MKKLLSEWEHNFLKENNLEIEEKKLFGIRNSINYEHIEKTLKAMKSRERHNRNFFSPESKTNVEKLLLLLKKSRKFLRRSEIAKTLGISERTVSEKIRVFRQLGLIDSDKKGYFIKFGFNRFLKRFLAGTLPSKSL